MNKPDLITAIATKTGFTKVDASKFLDATLEIITKTLKKKEEVRLIGFGAFSVANRAATTGRNPRTGEPIKIAAAKLPKFKAGQALKDAVA